MRGGLGQLLGCLVTQKIQLLEVCGLSEGPIRSHYCECIDNVPDIFQAFRLLIIHDSVDFSCGISIPMVGHRFPSLESLWIGLPKSQTSVYSLENEGF